MRIAWLDWIPPVLMAHRLTPRGVWMRSTATTVIVAALLCLAGANIVQRASWSEVEDGVLWRNRGGDIVAMEVAPGTAADRAGVHRGDILQAIDGREIQRIEDLVEVLHASAPGTRLSYTILRQDQHSLTNIDVQP